MAASVTSSTLSLQQAQDILQSLSLLDTTQHKNSKLVCGASSVYLEENIGFGVGAAWRYAANTVNYYKGHEILHSVDPLPVLIEKVQAVMTAPERVFNLTFLITDEKTRVEKAEAGLQALRAHQYGQDDAKQKVIDKALTTLDQMKQYFEGKSRELQETNLKKLKDLQPIGGDELARIKLLLDAAQAELSSITIYLAGAKPAILKELTPTVLAQAMRSITEELAARATIVAK